MIIHFALSEVSSVFQFNSILLEFFFSFIYIRIAYKYGYHEILNTIAVKVSYTLSKKKVVKKF